MHLAQLTKLGCPRTPVICQGPAAHQPALREGHRPTMGVTVWGVERGTQSHPGVFSLVGVGMSQQELHSGMGVCAWDRALGRVFRGSYHSRVF